MKKRRITQVVFLVLLNMPLLGPWLRVCVPVLNCHSCPWAVFACPVGVIGHFGAWSIFPFLAVGTIFLIGGIFGRFLCGWVCPFGLLQDLLYKIPSPKWTVPRWMRFIKYGVVVVMVLLVPYFIGILNVGFFCSICPAGTLESLVPRTIAAGDYQPFVESWHRLAILGLIIFFAIVAWRSFCKVLCPIGAFLAICNRFSAFSIKYEQKDCPSCRICVKDCPMDIELHDFGPPGSLEKVTAPPECIMCLSCTDRCVKEKLSFSLWNLLPRRRKKKKESKHEGTK